MTILRSLASAFSMFSRLPVPQLKWRGDNMRFMLAMFPFVGAVVGLFIWAWLFICDGLAFGTILRAAGLALLPIAVTGGIHLDGFCDTADALASHAPPERKREILKDPHTGAFALIAVASYLLISFALFSELTLTTLMPLTLGLTFVVSRSLSGLAVLLFPTSAGKGLADTFKTSADKRVSTVILIIVLCLAVAGLIISGVVTGLFMTLTALACFAYLYLMSRRQFGGMSGDLAGYFLQLCELLMLAALILVQKAVSA